MAERSFLACMSCRNGKSFTKDSWGLPGKGNGEGVRISVERGRIPTGLSETASHIRWSENWNDLSAVPTIDTKIRVEG